MKSKIRFYFSQKIGCYKAQDNKANRKWEEDDYITTEWIKDQWSKLPVKCCPMCRCPFEKYLDENKKCKTNSTVDRLDNRIAHIKSNCQLMCVKCNITKH